MTLKDLGYNEQLEKSRQDLQLQDFEIGRVIAEHKERYTVACSQGETEAEITGHLRFTARGREDFPAVGDWVAMMVFDPGSAIIHRVLPRQSVISRKATGREGEIQIIAANIDYAFLLQAVDRDYNINRLERYLTLVHASRVKPIIILTKTDLIDETKLKEIKEQIIQRLSGIPLIEISNETRQGYEALQKVFEKGKTYCMLGSSGVGKSTLLNNLSGRDLMKTDAISKASNRGRHITSHREMRLLENGSILIDNPGMREVGITDTEGGIESTFEEIIRLSSNCRFKDCTHTSETGCAVLKALENGEINAKALENYQRMEREKAHFESTVAERRKKDKDFGKMVKHFKKIKKEKQ